MQQNGSQNDGSTLIRASWAPVYLEPIRHSGERITIANAILSEDRSIIKVVGTLHPSVLRCLFGNRQDEILNLADIITTDLKSHLLSNSVIDNWEPALPGVFLGKVRKIKDYSVDDMIKKIVPATSALGVTEEIEAEQKKPDHITSQVKKIITLRHPGLANNFNRELEYRGKKIATISYVDQKIAANFTAIKPHLSNQRNALDAVIRSFTDMNSLIKRSNLFDSPDWSGVIIQQPEHRILTLRQENALENQLSKIQSLSEDMDIPSRFVNNAEEIVEIIVG